MQLGGQTFERGQPIPAESIRGLPTDRLKQLVDHRFVHEDSTRVSSKKDR